MAVMGAGGRTNALFRRTLLAVETPRRASVRGGHPAPQRRAAARAVSACMGRVDEDLPAVEARETDLAAYWEKLV